MDLKLKNVRCNFIQDLFEAAQFKGAGAFRFSSTFLVPKGSPQDKEIKAAIKAEAEREYGKKAASNLALWENNSGKYCYMDGDLSEHEGYEGNMVLTAHTTTKPRVMNKNPNVILTAQDGIPYAGCYVNALVSIYPQKGDFAGIRCSFSGVQFAGDGDAFGGGRPASAGDFDDLSEGAGKDDLV